MLYETMQEIKKDVPEIANNWDRVYARIKTHIHGEKHFLWFLFHLHFLENIEMYYMKPHTIKEKIAAYFGFIPRRNMESFVRQIKQFVDAKTETHDSENWGKFERNLEWVEKYGGRPGPEKMP